MDNDEAIKPGEDEFATGEDGGLEAEPDTFEVDVDGEIHTLPAALKGGFLRHADYTRKTQELAEHRRVLAADREALDRQAAAHEGASADQHRLAAMEHQLEDMAGVDWQAYAAHDPRGAEALWATYQKLAQGREQLAYAVAHHAERRELKAARETADAMAETGRTLAKEIDGWSPDIAHKLVEYAQAFGVTREELGQAADPRLWKLLHKAWRADQTGRQEAQVQAQAVRPAVLVSGGAGGGGGVRDELGTKEWMRRRNDQMARGR